MKKGIIFLMVILTLCLSACGQSTKADEKETPDSINKPDIDLTILSSTMVYSEVSNIMQQPDRYIGKSIKISGIYLPMTGSDGTTQYPACLIQDATACCQQGIEFKTKDGNYPKEGTMMIAQGEFSPYTDAVDGQTYYHLEDTVIVK